MSSFSLLLVSTLKFEAFTFPITSLCCFLAQTPRCIIWKVNTDLCVKNRHGRALNYLLLPEGDFPPSLRKLSWLGQTAHFSADYRTTELSRQPESPSPVPDQCGPHLSGGPPLLCLAGWECHHPKNGAPAKFPGEVGGDIRKDTQSRHHTGHVYVYNP